VEEFKYLGTTLMNQNSVQEEIKSTMNSGNACCLSEQNLLSSSLLSKNVMIKIYRTVFFFFFLYGWLLMFMEGCRLRVLEYRVLFGPKRDEVTGDWRNLHNEELNNLCSSPNVRVIKLRIMRWVRHVALMGGGETYTGFCWVNLKEIDHVEDPGIDGRIIL
jgi:hypothetical protein